MTGNKRRPLTGEIFRATFDPNTELCWACRNCNTHLPKDGWSIRTTDSAAIAEVDCPTCGEHNDIRIE